MQISRPFAWVGLLFSVVASVAHAQIVADPLKPVGPAREGVQTLALSTSEYESLRSQERITIPNFPRGSGARLSLTLERMHIFAEDVKFVAASADGEVELPPPDIQFFSGEVTGEPGSRVFLALSPNGTSGSIFSGGRTSIISSGVGGTMPTVIFETDSKAAERINISMPTCGGGLLAPGQDPRPPFGNDLMPQSGVCRVYRLAIDCDAEFLMNLFAGNQPNATAYVSTLVAGMNDIYRRDVNVMFNLAYVRLWWGADPYTAANTGDQLTEFQAYWQANMSSVNRNLAHLLSGRGLGGGVAWVSNVCSAYSYAVSANIGGYYPYPLLNNSYQNWDIMVFAHETGHNVGTGHTHDINSYDPIIDGCGNGDCTVASQHLGTIMSYCHTCSGGMSNIRLELGSRVANSIRSFLDSASFCGTVPAVSFSLQPRNRKVCLNGEARFSVFVNSPAPITYQWQRNGQNIPGATTSVCIVPDANSTNTGTYRCVVQSWCASATSTGAELTVCYADFNCDQIIDFTDYLDFVDMFSLANPAADIDSDGTVDFTDYLDFVDAFSIGC